MGYLKRQERCEKHRALPLSDRGYLASRTMKIDLALLALFGVLLFVIFGPVEHIADDKAYGGIAETILDGTFELRPHNFYNRPTITLPTAAAYAVFGRGLQAKVLWSETCLLAGALLLYAVGRRGWGRRVGLVAALLYLLNPVSLRFGLALYPEPIVTAFMLGAATLVWVGRERDRAVWGVAAALVWWLGFFAKASAVWALPFFALLCLRDFYRRRAERFWLGMILAGLSGAGAFLATYGVLTGDPLYRLAGWESHSLHHWYTFKGATWQTYLDRLTVGPFREIGAHVPYLVIWPWALYGLWRAARERTDGADYWALYGAALLAWWWFGSTSLEFYNPIHYSIRHVFPIFPAVCLFAAVGLDRLRSQGPTVVMLTASAVGALAACYTGYCGGVFFYAE